MLEHATETHVRLITEAIIFPKILTLIDSNAAWNMRL